MIMEWSTTGGISTPADRDVAMPAAWMADATDVRATRERVPKGSSAVVVIATAERVGAMSEALANSAETFDRYRLGPAADAELRSALAAAPPSTTSRQRG